MNAPLIRSSIASAAAAPAILVVPGLHGSGEDHWQSRWCRQHADCRRVDLGDWERPTPAQWIARLDHAIEDASAPILLAAHSLGCLAVAAWAADAAPDRLARVRGALLVAPPDVDRDDADPALRPFAPAPSARLPFQSVLVASRDDPYATFARLGALAKRWGCRLVDAGPCGHINAASGLEDWPRGKALLDTLRT